MAGPSRELRSLGKKPKKELGQNFVTDSKLITDIVEAGEVADSDLVVEIGPGLGALTHELVEKAAKVLAIEKDRELAENLRAKNLKNLTVITGDALDIDWAVTISGPYKIIANIPYSITSPLLRKIFSLDKKPSLIVLLVQKEVAERLVASPGSSARGLLTVIREANSEAKIVRSAHPGSFKPQPTVDSAVIKLTPFEKNRMAELFWPAVEAGFRHKRQTLANALLKDLEWPKEKTEKSLVEAGLTKMARAEELSFEQWVGLGQAADGQWGAGV